MKTISILIFLFLISSYQVKSQSSWVWQNPFPTGNNLSDLQFTDLHTGYAVGDLFTFLKTTNSGENWNLIYMNIDSLPQGSGGNITSIFFINSLTGYISSGNYIMQTINGGENWTYKFVGGQITSIYFTSLDTGYAVGFHNNILKTTNQGNSWVIQYTSNTWNNRVYFIFNKTGFVVGRNLTVLKTTNGGDNWVLKLSNTAYDLFDVTFLDSSNGFAAGSFGYFYKTHDGGNTWIDLRSSQLGYIRRVRFLSPDTGYVIADNGNKIFKTVNGGNQWSLLLDSELPVSKFIVLPNNNFVISCFAGSIFKSSNAGSNWQNKIRNISTSNLQSVSFISNQTGFIAGSEKTILKTTTGGSEWEIQNTPSQNDDYSYIEFFDDNHGFLAGQNFYKTSYLYKTSNAGKNWDSLFDLEDIHYFNFYNKDTGYVVKRESFYINFTLRKTFDGGNNWINSSLPDYFGHICFLKNNNFGYVLNSIRFGMPPSFYYHNTVYKTTNNGSSWNLLSDFGNVGGTPYDFITFTDTNTGFVYGQIGMKKTTNGGANWFSISSPAITKEIFFCNQDIGYASSNNSIVKTINSGNNWTQVLVTSNSIISYFFNDLNTGYTVGFYGHILKTTNGGGILVNVNEENEIVPLSFNLYQNYPNPFNPVTKIEFDVSIKSRVRLLVYDLLGRKIESIVDSDLSAGRYAYEFDGSNLSSGIYFYRLDTDNFSQTKRMLLIK